MHPAAVAALEHLLRAGDTIYVTPQNVIEFWNVCTRPLDKNGLGLSPAEAHRETVQLESFLTVLPEIPAIYPEWRRLVVEHAVSGVQVHDARIAATMMVYGVKNILTFNGTDFVRFTELRVVHPNQAMS
jgi:predicted nucleic acid-binding protein